MRQKKIRSKRKQDLEDILQKIGTIAPPKPKTKPKAKPKTKAKSKAKTDADSGAGS